MKVKSYEELTVWQEAMKLAEITYALQRNLPREETFGLGDQIRRAVVSVASNIAEGFGRESTKDFVHFLHIARGSLFEVKTQIELARRLGYLPTTSHQTPTTGFTDQADSVGRLINALIRSLTTNHQSPTTK